MRIVLTGSGSGGHFYPLIAVAEALTRNARAQKLLPPECTLMAPEPYDAGALGSAGIAYTRVPAGKWRRYFSLRNFLDLGKTLVGCIVALWKLFLIYPDAIFSKGSYTSIPVVFAAAILRIPLVAHESDARPGRANRIAARFARTIAVSYADSARHFQKKDTLYTGIPLRSQLTNPSEANSRQTLGIGGTEPLIVVLGGSQGAERINDLIVSSLDELLPHYAILHQCGERHTAIVQQSAQALTEAKDLLATRYHVRGFLDVGTLGAAYHAAALVVARAGSGTIHELALFGVPAILIPIPESISHDQRENAYAYAKSGAALVMEEPNLTPHLLAAQITRIMGDSPLQQKMKTAAQQFAPRDAAEKIAALLIAIGLEHEPR